MKWTPSRWMSGETHFFITAISVGKKGREIVGEEKWRGGANRTLLPLTWTKAEFRFNNIIVK